jgi:HAD superfamily phosphoserine phosphatase-like hydrolase
MRKKVIVFDFDKTLTEKDTLFDFYKSVSPSKLSFSIKYPLFLLVAIATKLGFISNYSLKKAGVRFYLYGIEKKQVEKIANAYSSQIALNEIYHKEFFKYAPDDVLIMSASYEEYLKPLFLNYLVVGSKLRYDLNNRVDGIELNMYGKNKQKWLFDNGITEIDILYTDSISDKPLMDIAKTTILVKDNKMQKYQ